MYKDMHTLLLKTWTELKATFGHCIYINHYGLKIRERIFCTPKLRLAFTNPKIKNAFVF